MVNIDLTDSKVRAEYFQPTVGRPTDSIIISAVVEMVAFVGPDALTDDPFLSNDICLAIWDDYPDQHVYIGHRVSKLEKARIIPIKRLGTINTRSIYSLDN